MRLQTLEYLHLIHIVAHAPGALSFGGVFSQISSSFLGYCRNKISAMSPYHLKPKVFVDKGIFQTSQKLLSALRQGQLPKKEALAVLSAGITSLKGSIDSVRKSPAAIHSITLAQSTLPYLVALQKELRQRKA